jgi:hypothetical protein
MENPYVFMLLGLVIFAAMGIFHKLGDRCLSNSMVIAGVAMGVASVVSTINIIAVERKSLAHLPRTRDLECAVWSFGELVVLSIAGVGSRLREPARGIPADG